MLIVGMSARSFFKVRPIINLVVICATSEPPPKRTSSKMLSPKQEWE